MCSTILFIYIFLRVCPKDKGAETGMFQRSIIVPDEFNIQIGN